MFELNGKYTNAIVYTDLIEEEAISQILGLCNHPVFKDAKIRVMPDVHAGAGCTIGTTIELKENKVIPNIVGVDIGCGVLTTVFKVKGNINFKELDNFIVSEIPNGCNVRERKHPKINSKVERYINEIVDELNFGNLEYHLNSVGSLGGGNHYIEIGKLNNDTYTLSVHCGSRNLGKKVCEYFQRKAVDNVSGKKTLAIEQKKLIERLKAEGRSKDISSEIESLKEQYNHLYYGFPIELAYIEDEDFEDYIKNMKKCQAMAKNNRQLISEDILNFLNVEIIETFDTIHNYIEELSDSNGRKIIIRKGAISAKEGEKVAIPLNMKDGVVLAVGKGNSEWNCSAPHGAGRLLSRSKAKETVDMEKFKEDMKGINTWSVCSETIDEAPDVYKPADMIVKLIKDTVTIENIVKPIYNFKAHAPEKTWAEIKQERKNKSM